MNFLGLLSHQTSAQELETQEESNYLTPKAAPDGLTEDTFRVTSSANDHAGKGEGAGRENGGFEGLSVKNGAVDEDKHIDVREEEGWITIPFKELPDSWSEEPDVHSLRSFDRPFVFPGEQVHILACLSAYKQDIEIITPFKVAEVMNKNRIGQNIKKQNGGIEHEPRSVSAVASRSDGEEVDQNANDLSEGKIDPKKYVSAGETLLRMEDHRRQTEMLLQRFRNSHFFARIAEADEPLWSKRKRQETFRESTEIIGGKFASNDAESSKGGSKKSLLNTSVDRGSVDASTSGGVARNGFKCCALANGDLVVLLQVNIGVDVLKDPVLEIMQFEKYQERTSASGMRESLVPSNQDACGDLLKWLLPLDNSLPPPPRSLSPQLSSSSSIRSSSIKANPPSSSGSPIFSFNHFRSYSMTSISANSGPTTPVSTSSSRSSFDLEDWDQFSSKMSGNGEKSGDEELLSFRGVQLEPERFSVRCGLEGIYVPGRRWKRKIEIIQPVEIRSFAADCNTEDLLCVQIKNVSPAHAPDIVIYLDTITVIYEEASKGGPPLSLPIACIEAGYDHNMPDLALRRGEEHSFILKPATSLWRSSKGKIDKRSRSSRSQAGSAASNVHDTSNLDHNATVADKYAILVSCRCNYTESRLFFKQPTSWRPRISRDLLISVESRMSSQTVGSDDGIPRLPVQVLTLEASNLTSEDLTLTVLAPASFTSPPSVVSFYSSPAQPASPVSAFGESIGRASGDRQGTALKRLNSASRVLQHHRDDSGAQTIAISDVLPRSDLGCTHLWLQSRVPLGCVPSRSTATIKLELVPLTDGIITLDSLQISIKEKGEIYIPEHSLKIHATSSLSSGIV